jgi:hypothetical protein
MNLFISSSRAASSGARNIEKYHVVIVHQQFLLVEGQLQNQGGVISVKAESIKPLHITGAETTSHDFH